MLGFSCEGTADRNYPIIGPFEMKLLLRFFELYSTKGNILNVLITQAKKKFDFNEDSVRFWAPKLIEGCFGPFEPLFSEELEEIMINEINGSIFVYDRKKGMEKTNLKITSKEYFLEIVNRMLSPLGRRVNQANPRESGILENGDRLSVAIPPYAREYSLSIRRYASDSFTLSDLVDLKMLTYEAAAFLWAVIESGNINVGIVGNTGSGKTTLLNALITFFPKKSRIVIIEDIPEIRPLQEQVVGLISNKTLKISMKDSILDSLRLRPDRVIVGEVRSDEEVGALRESCLAGHALGTYFTYHAESLKLAYSRLMSQGFPKYDLSVISLIVVCKRYEIKGRAVRRVIEIGGKKPIFLMKKNKLKKVNDFESEYLQKSFVDFEKEIKNRIRLLKSFKGLKPKEVFMRVEV